MHIAIKLQQASNRNKEKHVKIKTTPANSFTKYTYSGIPAKFI